MRQFCTVAAATSMVLATASAANAAIITDGFVLPNNVTSVELNDGNPIAIDGFGNFSVFYNYRTGTAVRRFNDIFGSADAPSGVSFDPDFANAASQALSPLVAPSGLNFLPERREPNRRIGWIFDNVTGATLSGYAMLDGFDDDGNVPFITDISRGNNFGEGAGFLTFQESTTAVPTPALLPGLIGLGFSAIRKRNLAKSDEA